MQEWDYIVVGAGSAGCVVAHRLSENSSVNVLLIEAGPSANDFWLGVPAGMAKVVGSGKFDWCFTTEPNEALNGRTMPWPRGKTLGGSSAINGMVYTRGNRRDFDHWVHLGNKGWGWDEVLPYFKLLEDNENGASALSGVGGPQKVSDSKPRAKAVLAFIEAAHRAGIPKVLEFSQSGEEGVGQLQATISKGVRQSTYEAYIAPVKSRKNLSIWTETHTLRVLIENRRAVGVEVRRKSGEVQKLRARCEVVLSAGTTNSPHILMLSGVGNAAHLKQFGIESVVHLPGVGQNLQDHCGVHLKVETKPGWSYNHRINGWRKYIEGARWVFTKTGYLTASATMAAAFTKSSPDMEYADLEIGFRPITFTFLPTRGVEVDSYPAISANVYRVRPASRGEILLRSPDPLQPAAFHTRFMSAEEDLQATLVGMHQMRKIMSMEPLASAIVREIHPGSEVQSDADLIEYIRANGKSAYHCVGTCKMGRDAMGVVDERLRLRGIEGLRVVDASIMPIPSSGNPNATTIMIGEKGADMILEDAKASCRAA